MRRGSWKECWSSLKPSQSELLFCSACNGKGWLHMRRQFSKSTQLLGTSYTRNFGNLFSSDRMWICNYAFWILPQFIDWATTTTLWPRLNLTLDEKTSQVRQADNRIKRKMPSPCLFNKRYEYTLPLWSRNVSMSLETWRESVWNWRWDFFLSWLRSVKVSWCQGCRQPPVHAIHFQIKWPEIFM